MDVQIVEQINGWNEWLTANPFGDILQSWEWGEVKKDELWKALRVRVVDGGQVLCQAQILTRKMPLGMSLYYMPRGPVLDYENPRAAEILKTLLDWTKDHAAKHRGLMVKLGPAVDVVQLPHIKPVFEQLGLKPSFRTVQSQHTYIVDLQPSEIDILQSFDKDTRNLVRRSAKEGVVVDKFSTVEEHKALRTFHNLYLAASENGRFVPRPWSQFSRLWEVMAPLGVARVYIASFEDTPLAANMVLRLGNKSYQLWAGSRRDEPKKFATYALQWAAMQDLKIDGVTSYDMWGRAPGDDPKHPWQGITLFKKGFGGREVDYIGDYDLPLSPSYPLFTVADKARSRMLGQS